MNRNVKQAPLKEGVKAAVRKNQPWDVVRFAMHLPNFARLFMRLLRDARVNAGPKLLLIASVVYALSPMDFLPDLMPVLGQMDDLGILLLGCRSFLSLCPRNVVEQHVNDIDQSGQWTPIG